MSISTKQERLFEFTGKKHWLEEADEDVIDNAIAKAQEQHGRILVASTAEEVKFRGSTVLLPRPKRK